MQTGRIKSYEDLEKVNPLLSQWPRFQKDFFDENIKLLQQIEDLAAKKNCTPAQVAIAWVKSHSGKQDKPIIIPIPGATTPERVAENSKEVVLTDAELKNIQAILDKFEVKGDRFPAALMAQLDT